MRDKHKTLFVISGLTIIVLAVFWQVRSFEFVNYDDDKYVSENNHILTGVTWDNVAWVFTNQHGGHWHPLTGLSHMLDCELFGLDAGRHHLVNVLFHIANTLLLFTVFRRMTGAFWQSAFVAALFALHPLHVESVAWISERKDVLSTLLWLLTMAAYFWYVKNPTIGRYVLTLVLFALGLMAKPMLVTLPFVLLLLDYWPLNRFGVKATDVSGELEEHHEDNPANSKRQIGLYLLYEKIPFFVVAVISSIVTFFVYRNMGMVTGIQSCPLSTRIGNTVVSYVKYMGQMVWPRDLAMFYPYPDKLPQWQVIGSAVLLVVITILMIRLGAKYRYLPVGWLWYIGTLVPVIGIIRVGDQAMADRYTYVPLTGLFIIIAWGANDLLAQWKYKRTVLGILSIVIILVLSFCAWFQTGFWHDNISLFGHAIKVTSGNYLAYNNRGSVYYNKGELDKAISDYNNAIEANHNYVDAYNNRGNAYRDKGEYERAISDYNKALAINPRYVEAYYNRGNACWDKGEYDLAISDYNKALEINPRYADVYNNRGNAYKHKGQLDLAIADYSKAIEINPKSAESYYNRGGCYAQDKGQFDLAISDYNQAIVINPLYAQAYCNRGNTYYSKGQLDNAIADFNKAIEIDPKFGVAYLSKANACENSGHKKEAIEAYKAFIRCASAEYAPYIEQARGKIKDLEQ